MIRTIKVPDKIILSDGTNQKEINFESCEVLEYLKLCIGLQICREDGIV